jgi:hypothetical protein
MAVHAFTSFSFSYLNRARVLARSIRQQHPDWVIWAVVTDRPPSGFTFELHLEDFDMLITAEELFGEETNRHLFRYDIIEACTAVKARALRHILASPGAEKVIYLDPDIALFNPMNFVIDLLDDHAIVLTPHQIDPEPAAHKQAILDNEIGSLTYGVFNLGFIAVSQHPEAHRFTQWWADRLNEWCHDRPDMGVFVDQKWCNLIPCFFDSVKVLRDPGYNVASWNLSQRRMHFDKAGQALINGAPLRFYHFTKLGPVGETMTRRYAGDNFEFYELWWWYRREVIRHTSPRIPKDWWYYGAFDNGKTIPKAARELYRDRYDFQNVFSNPFLTDKGSYYDWLCRETGILEPD